MRGSWLLMLLAVVPLGAQSPPPYVTKLAPYVSSPARVVDRMLELARIKPG